MTTAELDVPTLKRIPADEKAGHPDVWFWAGWEPQKHYRRRGGSRGTLYFGNGPWVKNWEARLFSDEAIDLAADMGATVLMTQFYKGIGRQVESSLWPKLGDFTERCHRRGIKVWGYVQGSSLYPEFMLSERPDLYDWVSRDYHGEPQSWGASYFRLMPCLTSEAYRDYMLSVIRDGVSVVGLDGIQLDNSYYKHCWCTRCQDQFRSYLTERGDLEQTTAIPDARHIVAPPLPKNSDYVQDPLRIHWMEFGVQTRLHFYRQMRAAIKEANPDALFSSNSAYPRTDLASELRLGLSPANEGQLFDYCCAENGNQPRCEKGVFIGETDACLLAEAGGYRVWITAWRRGEFGNSPAPDAAGIWAVAAEEFSFGSAMMGNNWALRSGGEGDSFLCEKISTQTNAFAEVQEFFRTLYQEESLGSRRSWTDVAVLFDAHSLSIAAPSDMPALRQLMQYFFRTKIPFQFVFPGREIPDSVNTLVVWSASCLAKETLDQLSNFAGQPHRQVVASEAAGTFDEWHVPYDFGFLREWQQRTGMKILRPGAIKAGGNGASASHFHDATVALEPATRSVLDEFFLNEDAFSPRVRLSVPELVLVHTERSRDGDLLVHLRDQAGSGHPVCGAKVWVTDALQRSDSARFYAPGHIGDTVSAGSAEGGRQFLLPDFLHYGLLVIPAKS